MRILFLTHAFNSLTQRLFVELQERGHEVSVEFDINDDIAVEAVELFGPDLIHRAISQARDPRGQSGASMCAWWCIRAFRVTAALPRWTGPS